MASRSGQSLMRTLEKGSGWSKTEDGDEWQDFVTRNEGSVFHSWSWRKVLEGSKSRPLYLVYRGRDGGIRAVCPFFYRTGRFLGFLDSLPHSHTGGPIIGAEMTNATEALKLLRKSVRFSPFNPVIALRIRTHQRNVIEPMVKLGFEQTMTQLFIVDLRKTIPDHIWNNGFHKHDRQAVKYFEQEDTTFTFARVNEDYVGYTKLGGGLKTEKDKGEGFVGRMRAHLGDGLKVALAIHDGRVAAGVSVLCNRADSTASLLMMRYDRPRRNIHSPVTYLNWKVVNWAFENGFRYVNFGSYPMDIDSKPRGHPFRFRVRFEVAPAPRYQFIVPTSNVSYAIARGVSQIA